MNRLAIALFCWGLLLFTCTLNAQDSSFLGAPAACSVALKQDLYVSVKTSSEKMAYLGIIDSKTYDVLKREADTGGSYGIISGTGNFSQFEDQRRELYKLTGYHFEQANANSILSAVTSARSYDSFDTCMRTLDGEAIGFHAWKSSEDQNDLIVSCVYNAPPATTLSRFSPKQRVRVTVVGGSSGKPTRDNGQNQRLGPGDHCKPIIVNRKAGNSIKLTVGIDGYQFVVIDSAYGTSLSPNIATSSWTPLDKKIETISYDQSSDPAPSNSGTVNMDGRGGCPAHFDAMSCSPDGQHVAAVYIFTFGPPKDGDLIDPGQQLVAHARSVHGDGSEQFCGQYLIRYQDIYMPRPGYEGKHFMQILTRCWSHPALWSASISQYRMVPALVPTVDDPLHFVVGEDILLRIPEKTPASIKFSYGSGKVVMLKPGESSVDGKIKFARVTNFAGHDFYIYNYIE